VAKCLLIFRRQNRAILPRFFATMPGIGRAAGGG
jgi:hypothetical protein